MALGYHQFNWDLTDPIQLSVLLNLVVLLSAGYFSSVVESPCINPLYD